MKSLRMPVLGKYTHGVNSNFDHRSSFSSRVTQNGFSMLELLSSISIAGILGVMATSSASLMQSHVTAAELNGLMADFAYARTNAIKRQQTITICASVDGDSCDSESQWSRGWIIFTDEDRDRVRDAGDQLLRVQGPLRDRTQLTQGSGYYYYVMYRQTGMSYPNSTFTFCHGAHYRRAIIMFRSGRARVSTVSSSGETLNCEAS